MYRYIRRWKVVSLEEIYAEFCDISREMINIFLDVLVRKNFVKFEDNKLSV